MLRKSKKISEKAPVYAWLLCSVKPGMFDSEYAVSIDLPEGDRVSLFADKRLVEFKGKTPFLEVYAWPKPPKGDRTTVLLPTESFEKGSRWLNVTPSQVQSKD